MEYTTIVEKNDLTFSYRVYRPCKKFEVIFNYDENQMDVTLSVFAFKDCQTNLIQLDKERINIIYNKGSIMIKIEDWILPGDGVIFVISDKNRT